MRRDFGDEVLIAVIAVGVIAFAIVFGIVLSLVGNVPIETTLLTPSVVAMASAEPTDDLASEATIEVSNTLTATPTDEPTARDTVEPSAIATETASPTATDMPSATPTDEPTATDTVEPSATVTETASPTATDMPSATPTDEPTATDTVEPSATPAETASATATDMPSATPTETASATATDMPSATPTETASATATDMPSATPTDEPTATDTVEPSATPTETASATATGTPSATPTDEPTATDTVEPSATPTETASPTATDTPSATPTDEPTSTDTVEPSATPTETASPTVTDTPSATPTATPTPIPTGFLRDGECVYPPGVSLYMAQENDTLASISGAFGLALGDVLAVNCLESDSVLTAGDVAYLPLTVSATQTPDGIENLWERAGCSSPRAANISSPLAGEVVSGEITIVGTAFSSDFTGYRLEVRAEHEPVYTPLRMLSVPVIQSAMGTVDFSGHTPGLYWVRLIVETDALKIPPENVCVVPVFIR